MESIFNKVAGLKVIFLWTLHNFSKNITEHLQITASADPSVPTKVFITLFSFFPLFFPFCYWELSLWEFVQKGYDNEDFLLFRIIYPKINMIVVKTIAKCRFPTADAYHQLPSAKMNFEGWKVMLLKGKRYLKLLGISMSLLGLSMRQWGDGHLTFFFKFGTKFKYLYDL